MFSVLFKKKEKKRKKQHRGCDTTTPLQTSFQSAETKKLNTKHVHYQRVCCVGVFASGGVFFFYFLIFYSFICKVGIKMCPLDCFVFHVQTPRHLPSTLHAQSPGYFY